MTRHDEIYLSFLEHPIFKEKYEIDVDTLPKKISDGPTDIKIIDTLRLMIRMVELNNSKTDREIISIINKSLNE